MYSENVFFVPPASRFFKIEKSISSAHFGDGAKWPHRCDQGPRYYPPYKFGSDPRHFSLMQFLFDRCSTLTKNAS